MSELNEQVTDVISDATVVTVPIDDTLSISGEAADAKAVGDALALKADASSVVSIDVNGQSADNQGHIIVDGTEIQMSSTDDTTLKAAIEAAAARDGSTIPIDDGIGAQSIKQAIGAVETLVDGLNATNIPMSGADGASMISAKISAMDATTASLSDAVSNLGSKTADQIKMSSTDNTTVKAAVEARLVSVNGITGDEDGNAYIDNVPFADNLRSSMSQNVVATFNQRTAGGGASIDDGDAWLTSIRGNRVHNGYVPESINMTVTMAEREEGEDTISATIDRDTFVEYVQSSGTITLTYTTSWSASPALYGITVTGTPKNGDVITVVYVKENRGTIVQSTPASYTATGWNLYNHTAGYARAIKYSATYGFCIEGSYTAVKFSTTLDGEKSTITPVDGYFGVPSNGYIWVEGGDNSTTEVYMTWEDWADTSDHPAYAGYSETVIDLSGVMGTYFQNGLLRAGDVRDEIDLNIGLAISNIERLSYSEENLAAAIATGRTYECDTDYIYLERATPVTSEITLDGAYTANDHGIEFFTGSTVPVYTVTLYGMNLKNKLERDVLTVSAQELTSGQKAQVQANLGVPSTNTAVMVTGDQSIAGDKTFTGSVNVSQVSRYKIIRMKQSGSNATTGAIEYDSGNGTNVTTGQMRFYEFSPKSDADTGTTGKSECYKLPVVDIGLDADKDYSILTTKNFAPSFDSIAGNSSKTFTVSNGARILLSVIAATGSDNMYLGFLTATSGGSVNRTDIKSASNLTFTNSTNSLTIANGSSNTLVVKPIVFAGGMWETTT